jgi:hypothetical protein
MKIAVFYQTTRCYNPEDSNLHTHRRENLKSYMKEDARLTDRDDSSEDRSSVAECAAVPATHAELILALIDGHLCSET